MSSRPYTLTWASIDGPAVVRFATLQDLAAYLSGVCRYQPTPVLAVNLKDWRL